MNVCIKLFKNVFPKVAVTIYAKKPEEAHSSLEMRPSMKARGVLQSDEWFLLKLK